MPTLPTTHVTDFLRTQLRLHARAVCPLAQGMFAQAFAFEVDGRGYVLRVNPHEEDFRKDALYQSLATSALPIPRVLEIGRFDATHHFAITERCAGETLNRLDEEQLEALVWPQFEALAALRGADVSVWSGWGLTDGAGHGQFESWEDYLLACHNQKFDYTLSTLLATTFLERELVERLVREIERCFPHLPTDKYLVHGDFGFDNAVADGPHLTGVLDWAEARLGDFVYDVAYLDFWSKQIPYARHWYAWATQRGLAVPYFTERLRCYLLTIGLNSLAIAAYLNDAADYAQVRARTLRALTVPED